MFKKASLYILLLCAFQGFYVEAGRFRFCLRNTFAARNDGPDLRKSVSAFIKWKNNGGYGRRQKASSNPCGTGILLMDCIVDGDLAGIEKRVKSNDDPVFDEHLAAMRLKMSSIQVSIDRDVQKYGEESSVGRQYSEERLKLFEDALSLLNEKKTGESYPILGRALKFLQRKHGFAAREARERRENR